MKLLFPQNPMMRKLPDPVFEHEFDNRSIRQYVWPAEIDGPALCRGIGECSGDRISDVIDEHRLQTRRAGSEQWNERCKARDPVERIKKCVARSEHDARPQDGNARKRRLDAALAIASGAHVVGLRLRIGADAGDMDQPLHPGLTRDPRHSLCTGDVNALESGLALLDIEANGIDGRYALVDCCAGRGLVEDACTKRGNAARTPVCLGQLETLQSTGGNPHLGAT